MHFHVLRRKSNIAQCISLFSSTNGIYVITRWCLIVRGWVDVARNMLMWFMSLHQVKIQFGRPNVSYWCRPVSLRRQRTLANTTNRPHQTFFRQFERLVSHTPWELSYSIFQWFLSSHTSMEYFLKFSIKKLKLKKSRIFISRNQNKLRNISINRIKSINKSNRRILFQTVFF